MTKDGAPAEEGHYKANVDVMMAIDALELSIEMRPDVVILASGDADFAYLATKLRRHGIRDEVASVAANLGNILRSAANDVIDLAPLFRTFDIINPPDMGRAWAGDQKPGRRRERGMSDRREFRMRPPHVANRTPRQQQQPRRRPRFRPVATARPGQS